MLLSWLAGYLFHFLSFFVCNYLGLVVARDRKIDDSDENTWRRMVSEPVCSLTGLICSDCFVTSIQPFESSMT